MSEKNILNGKDFRNLVLHLLGITGNSKIYPTAEKHGISRGIMQRVMAGKFPDPKNLVVLASALNVSIDRLLTGRENLHNETVNEEPAPYETSRSAQPEEVIALQILHHLKQKEVERWLRIGTILMDSEKERETVENKIEALNILWEGEEAKIQQESEKSSSAS